MLRTSVLASMVLFAATWAIGQTCGNSDYTPAPVPFIEEGTVGHSTSYHDGIASMGGSCQYDTIHETNCATYCGASSSGLSATDIGTISNALYYHAVTIGQSGGVANSNGGNASCATTVAASASAYLIGTSSGLSLSFNATASGIGTTVNFSAANLNFTPTLTDATDCVAKADPQYNCDSAPNPPRDCTLVAQLSARPN